MSRSSLNDTAMTSSSNVTCDDHQILRLNSTKSRHFGFRWKQRNSDEINTSKNLTARDLPPESLSNSKISNGFLKNIKKRLRIKNLSLCKVQRKIRGIDSQLGGVAAQASPTDEKASSLIDRKSIVSKERKFSTGSDVSPSNETNNFPCNYEVSGRCDSPLEIRLKGENSSSNENENSRGLGLECNSENDRNDPESENFDCVFPLKSGNVAEPQSTIAKRSVETAGIDAKLQDYALFSCKNKGNLSVELLKLSHYGWYWGPISGDEADSRLVSEPDGAFLVRDSSDDRYLLTLSFKSSGRLLHARMEHSGGLFSLCNQGDNEGFTSVAALIDHSMNSSQSAVFCYSRPKYPGYPSFPVRLTKPVSRFTQVRSLQYLCRFVIRQNTRLDNIHKLPLPKTIRGYIEEAHY